MIGLDFETYSAVDLPVHGAARYFEHETFRPLLGSITRPHTYTGSLQCHRLDFVRKPEQARKDLERLLDQGCLIVAHNAGFEQRVLEHLGFGLPTSQFIDSAMVARAVGGGSRLEAAAPQLLNTQKMEEGKELIKRFSIPGMYQEASGSLHFNPEIIEQHPLEWEAFGEYCDLDSKLGLELALQYFPLLPRKEYRYQQLTMDMNRTGWRVDIDLVKEMQRRYLENQEMALTRFRAKHDANDLNFNSLKQLKEWCADRGVKATSFDEKHVATLLNKIQTKLAHDTSLSEEKRAGYVEVEELLLTKQILGGSSLKKLQVILDTATPDPDNPGVERLYDQYLHVGAGQTWRTTGRSVQMQNLKRLSEEPADMDTIYDDAVDWSNSELANNLRQVFTATDPQGQLLVGDFSSVESRGLAYLAGATWKINAFAEGRDMYKVLASKIYHVHYDDVLKAQRQTGKVGELACGYGAGGDTVVAFAEGMGVKLEPAEGAKLVSDWRTANPETVELWAQLDEMFRRAVETRASQCVALPYDGLVLWVSPTDTPESLKVQHPGAVSIVMSIEIAKDGTFLTRFFHGCYLRGRDICYYKPSDRKTGDLWRSHFIHPKTKQLTWYKVYGGKIAGILTQSFCRELFFMVLDQVRDWVDHHRDQLSLVGQFHDEIVIDWRPGPLSLDSAKRQFEHIMSDSGRFYSFPLAAEIKSDYRYTK